MQTLQTVFNNRELALGAWIILAIVAGLFTKAGRKFLQSVAPIIFGRKFVVFYIIFLSFFTLTVLYLYCIGFWDTSLLKDTIFWIIFIEIPLFAKAIDKAKDGRFFVKLIRDNLTIIVVIDFLLNFWTFSLVVELIIVPIALFLGALYAFAARDEKAAIVKKFLNWLFIIFGIISVIFALYNLVKHPEELWNIETLKEFLLPILLLFMNLPVVYGLALYNVYEQVFLRVKGIQKEQKKMKRRIFRFAGINLTKITAVRNNLTRTTIVSLTDKDLEHNLKVFGEYLNSRIGDNYMKRPRFYILGCVIIIVGCLIGIVACNSTVPIADLLTFNFVLDMEKMKQIITNVLSTGLAVSLCFLIYFIGFRKKNYEDISQVKKFALHELLFLVKQQNKCLQEFPPIKDPQKLFTQYVSFAFPIKIESEKAISTYENLFTNWELDSVKNLQTYTSSFTFSIGIDDIDDYTSKTFAQYYDEKVASAKQSEKFNIFLSEVERSVKKYTEQIKQCMELFKDCVP